MRQRRTSPPRAYGWSNGTGRASAAHGLLRALAALGVLLCASVAHATPNFPGEIARVLGAPTPSCSVCHATDSGGAGTVTKDFGTAMVARGLKPYDVASLESALAAMEAEGVDSGDRGSSDIEALRQGEDPNGSGLTPPLRYGCAVVGGMPGRGAVGGGVSHTCPLHDSRRSGTVGFAAALVGAFALFRGRVRRRQSWPMPPPSSAATSLPRG